MILTPYHYFVRIRRTSAKLSPLEHISWLINPSGKVYNCGQDHVNCILLYPELGIDNKKHLDDLVFENGLTATID